MRPEQVTKLAEIEEHLVDLFITEAESAKWPGMETKEARGDRYWHKKNALATLTVVTRIQTVLREIRTGDESGKGKPSAPEAEEESIEQEAARLEKQGVALLNRRRAKKA